MESKTTESGDEAEQAAGLTSARAGVVAILVPGGKVLTCFFLLRIECLMNPGVN